jgi:hypothetical protein
MVLAVKTTTTKLEYLLKYMVIFTIVCMVVLLVSDVFKSTSVIKGVSVVFFLFVGALIFAYRMVRNINNMNNPELIKFDDPKTYENKIVIVKDKDIWMEK